MSIFGTTHPKIKTTGGTEIELENAFDFSHSLKPEIIQHDNYELFGKDFDGVGYHLTYRTKCNIFKWTSKETKYKNLVALHGQNVYLSLFTDGSYLEDSSGNDVLFYFKEFRHIYLDNSNMDDIYYFEFESMNYIDLSRAN